MSRVYANTVRRVDTVAASSITVPNTGADASGPTIERRQTFRMLMTP